MNESSLLNEYQKLLPGAEKLFVIPQIPDINKNTSYLYQLYKDFLGPSSPLKLETFNAASLPRIFFSRLKFEKRSEERRVGKSVNLDYVGMSKKEMMITP